MKPADQLLVKRLGVVLVINLVFLFGLRVNRSLCARAWPRGLL